MSIAYKLADRHPEFEFWRTLPVRRQVDSMVILWSQESRNKLTREFKNFQIRIAQQRSIVLDKPDKTYIIGDDKVGEDYPTLPKKPRSAVEFCR